MENAEKIVDYGRWCRYCRHWKLPEDKDPCHECLNEPVNIDSHKPVNFVPRFISERAGGKMKK